MRRLSSIVLAALFGLVSVVATGCSGGSDGSTSNDQPVPQRLATAKKGLDEARFIGFSLTSADLPDGTTVLESAHGTGTHAPAFTGEVQVRRGFSFTAPVVAVDGLVHAKLPFVGWSTIDPSEYGAPDPAALMDSRTGISSWLTEATGAHVTGTIRSGDLVLTEITGRLAGAQVKALFPSAALEPFQIVFALTQDDVLHSVALTGPIYGSDHGSSTYTIDLDLSADPVTITPPQ